MLTTPTRGNTPLRGQFSTKDGLFPKPRWLSSRLFPLPRHTNQPRKSGPNWPSLRLEPAFTGFSMDEAMGLVRSVRGLDVVGGDVVCLMPTKDSPNQITAQVAAAAMFELIALVAERAAA